MIANKTPTFRQSCLHQGRLIFPDEGSIAETSRDPYRSNPNIDVRILAQGYCVMPSLVYPYFELDIEQDEIHKALFIIKATI